MEIKKGMRVNTADDGPGTVTTIARNGEILVALDDGNEYWEPANEVTPLIEKQIPWQQHPATHAQMQYLANLNVDFDATQLTKGQASQLIDAAKNDTLGSVGGFYTDGSN